MSWTASFTTVRGFSAEEDLAPENAAYGYGDYADWEPHVKEQFEAAVEATKAILKSGAIGSDDKVFSVTLSGHANPGHEVVEGWANDAVVVSIVQRYDQPQIEPEDGAVDDSEAPE